MKDQIRLSSPRRTGGIALLALLLIVASEALHAQSKPTHMVRGTVLSSFDKAPLPGVTVLHVGTTDGIVTDENGTFEFPKALAEGDQLLFSFVGTMSKTHTVQGTEDEFVTILLEDTTVLIECYVTTASVPKKSTRLFAARKRR